MRHRLIGAAVAALVLLVSPSAYADHTPAPTSVTIAGSLQSELGCPGDWQPGCAATHLTYDGDDQAWQGSFSVPAGSWEYKAPLNDSWDENYGANATRDGANLALNLSGAATVKFYYDHETHWVTSNRNAVIAVAPGSFQSELGCPGDWQPDCLRSWLQDPDGDGLYSFATNDLPAGNYATKVAIDESWAENYGQGGVRDGADIPFSVPTNDAEVVFTYDASTHVLDVSVTTVGHGADDNVEWAGLRHDSRDTLYRTPGGAVVEGTPVKLRLRTFANDVTDVKLRLFDVEANGQRILPMERVASGVSCYQADLADDACDYWQTELANAEPNNLWYRFLVTDGSDTDYYADNTSALDGGLGSVEDDPVDNSYALTVSEAGFTTPDWAKSAVIYQIFPDRFANADTKNDPKTGDTRYDDPVLALPWNTLPEGYCRNYADGNTNCPWRFDDSPPDWSPAKEGPRGRDYMGGDLKGVRQKLDYLQSLGVTAIYFNPIFDARSNHRYDTADYTRIDPYLGDLKDWEQLVKQARERGIRVILDGVFNHMSSDSPFFDRYHHSAAVGACESVASEWRSWFVFTTPGGPCDGGLNYEGWFGFDTIPVLAKSLPAVQSYFLTAPNSITKLWLQRGAGGWRMDVSGDPSFPSGYWETFRSQVKGMWPDTLTISETWQKDTTLLRMMRGDRLDTSMNYRLRDAVIGLLSPQAFDSKGFADSGSPIQPSQFASRLASIYEDTPKPAADAFMNLLDSHDTERLRWTLTPGAETRAAREQNAANVAEGKARMKMASLVQFTVPGAPTVYYGDEVGVTGDDDPDDRRTMPWPSTGGSHDGELLGHYTALSALRRDVPALVDGDLRILLANDGEGTVAYGRKTASQAAIVALNRSDQARTLSVPVAGYVPDGTAFASRFGAAGAATVAGGVLSVPVPARSGAVLATGAIDLDPPDAPALQPADEGEGQIGLAWEAVPGAAAYNVYRSPVSGGGYEKANGAPLAGTAFTDTGLVNGRLLHYVVRALDSAGNESGDSNERAALPHLDIDWANLQWPPSLTHTISTTVRTDNVYGQVYIEGATAAAGQTPGLRAQLGFGPDASDPAGNAAWTWVEASFNTQVGNNDEFVASLLPEAVGTFDYAYRYSTTDGRDWVYADLNGIPYSTDQAGHLTVNSSGDTTAPVAPTGLTVLSASPAGIELSWDAVADPSLHGYEVRRSQTAGGPYTTLALVTGGTAYTDTDVTESETYHYVVRSVDTSFNRSGNSAEVTATAELRTVSVVFDVTVPASTDGTGRTVYIAGSLNRLDGGLPEWNPGGVALTRVDATHWTVTLTGKESTQIEYKFTLGDWDHVEKDGGCGEIGNRQLTLSYGATGTQTVGHTVENWRNVAPCGN